MWNFYEEATKSELIETVKRNKPELKYLADPIFQYHGHTILRLPPYHCDLNPIAFVWGVVKKRVASKNISCSVKQIKEFTEEADNSVTADV